MRARGPNRGGVGGGYERTDPDYEAHKLQRNTAEYLALEPQWRATFLRGLSRFEREQVLAAERRQKRGPIQE